jgi:hypothetical protein
MLARPHCAVENFVDAQENHKKTDLGAPASRLQIPARERLAGVSPALTGFP